MDSNYLRERYSLGNIRKNIDVFNEDDEEKRRQELLRQQEQRIRETENRRKAELEERKRQQKLEAKKNSIREMASIQNPLVSQPSVNDEKSSGFKGYQYRNPLNDSESDTPEWGNRSKSYNISDYKKAAMAKYTDYSSGLSRDVNDAYNYGKAMGLRDEEINRQLVPPEDNRIEERLEQIASKIRPGSESFGQLLQEGWYEKEIQNMISQETMRKMNGLPNKADVIQKWMQDHPELGLSEDANILDKGIRFLAEGSKQQLDSFTAAAKNWETWAIAGAIAGAGLLLAPVTGGASLAVSSTLLGKAVVGMGALGALKLGMSYGAMKNMAMLETADKYNQYIDEGVHPDIAKSMATTTGQFNGIVEFIQIDSAFSMIPGVKDLVENGAKIAGKEFTKKITRVAANYGKDLLGNAVEESIQEATGLMGLELSKYLEDAPNPNTLEGLKVLAKTFDKADYRDRVLQSGVDALQSMWLSPIVSSGARLGAERTAHGISRNIQINKVNGYYTAADKNTAGYLNEQKNMLLSEEENVVDMTIGIFKESGDEKSLGVLMTMEQVMGSIQEREDISNYDKERIQIQRDKVNDTVSGFMYDAKEDNSDIDYRPTNFDDVERDLLSPDFDGEIFNLQVNEFAIEQYEAAKKAGVVEVIREELSKGTPKAELANKITKLLPKKMRGPLDVFTMINSVDAVLQEIRSQAVVNNLYNYEQVRGYLKSEGAVIENNAGGNAVEQNSSENDEALEGQTDGLNVGSDMIEDIETDLQDANREYKTADVVIVPVNKIQVDPERFQFRFKRGNEGGATSKLVGAEWNDRLAGTVLLWQDEYNDLYAVNGHHRVDLAKASDVQELRAEIISYKEATAEEVRAIGAMINIAEDNATAIDVAKLIRDTGISMDQMQQFGVRPKSKIARDGVALSQLNDHIFTQVAVRKIPLERAVIIGRELVGNKPGQTQIVKAIDKMERRGKNITNDILTEMIAEIKGNDQMEFTEQTLFGEETFTKNLSVERAEVVSYVKRQLRDRVSLLKNVSKDKNARILNELGNSIAVDDNVRDMTAADQALYILDRTLNHKGSKVNEMFNNFAKEYAAADAQGKMGVKKKALNELVKLMEGGSLFNEEANGKTKRQRAKDSILEGGTAAEGRQESRAELQSIREEILDDQVDLFGSEVVYQLQKRDSVEVIVNPNTDEATKKELMPVIESMKNNVFFNGLILEFTGEESIKYYTVEELKKYGYEGYEAGYYEAAGYFRRGSVLQGIHEENGSGGIRKGRDNHRDNSLSGKETSRGKVIINNGAKRDTILHEVIHFIQDTIWDIDPETAALIQVWEDEVRAELKEDYNVLDGRELLIHSIMHHDLGHAKNHPLGSLTKVPRDIVDTIKVILGKEFVSLTEGKEEAFLDDSLLYQSKYESEANKNLIKGIGSETLEDAINKKRADIVSGMSEGKSLRYFNPRNGNYVIADSVGDKYVGTFFSPEFGELESKEYATIDALGDDLINNKYFYRWNEISYQLKKYTRSVADELYESKLSGRSGRDNSAGGTGGGVSFKITDNQIISAYHDAAVGNFNAHDFDELILNNDEVYPRTKNHLIGKILEAVDKGYDVPNSEVTFGQYMNRFYGRPIDYVNRRRFSPGGFTPLEYNESTGKVDFLSVDNSIKPGLEVERKVVTTSHYTLEKAVDDYKSNIYILAPKGRSGLLEEIASIVKKDFLYTTEMLSASQSISKAEAALRVEKDLYNQYMDFRDNMETYRHEGINYDLDMKPHYAISYQLKPAADIDTPEFKNWFKNSQVVDDEGKPLVVYHGTDGEFGSFKKGFNFFSSDKSFSNQFTSKNNIVEAYLSIQNLFDPFNAEHFDRLLNEVDVIDVDLNEVYEAAAFDIEMHDGVDVYEMSREMFADSYKNILRYDMHKKFMEDSRLHEQTWLLFERHLDKIKDMGFDGLKITEDGHENYVAFYPTQIKSVENEGMFDEYNPDINYQLKPVMPIVDVPGFYSNMEKVIDSKMGKRMKGQELLNMLTKNGVKPEEMQWFGIEDFVEDKDVVYKDELLSHMSEKPITISHYDMGDEFSEYTLAGGEGYRFNAYVYYHGGEPFRNEIHFGKIKNVIAHNRYTERVGLNGEKVLFIEELQSDWHQKGRADGYGLSIPDAPLKESVTDFLFKQAIKDAVKGGYDRIAWTTGAQQADRYNVGNYASEVIWERHPDDGKYFLDVKGTDGSTIYHNGWKSLKEVSDLLGNGIAKQIESSQDMEGVITGENLYIGGEFYKKLYDNYLPRMIKKYGKKWGISPEEMSIGNGIDLGGENYEDRMDNLFYHLSLTENWMDGVEDYIKEELDYRGYDVDEKFDTVIDVIREYGEDNIAYDAYKDSFYEEGGAETFVYYDLSADKVVIGGMNSYDNYIELGGWRAPVPNPDDLIDPSSFLYRQYENSNLSLEEFLALGDSGYLTQPSIPVTPQMVEDVMTEGQPLFQLKKVENTDFNTMQVSEGELRAILKMGHIPAESISKGGIKSGEISLILGDDFSIEAAVIPETMESSTKDFLKKNGVAVLEEYSGDMDRQEAIDRLVGARDDSDHYNSAWSSQDVNGYYQLKEKEEDSESKERSWGQTVRDSSITSKELKDLLTDNKFMYEVKHNENTILAAAELIDKKGEEWVEARLLSDLDDDAVLFAAGQVLTYKYMEQGETERAMSMVEKAAEKATSAGQAIQILSVWGRQTPEGMLRSVAKLFKDSMTDAERAEVSKEVSRLKDELNRLNREAIDSIDLAGTVRAVSEMDSSERLKRQLASTEEGQALANKYGADTLFDNREGMTAEDLATLEKFMAKTTIDSDKSAEIIGVIKNHYIEGKGNLRDKLKKLGLNDFEAEILNMYVKQQMRDYAKDQKLSLIGELPKKKYERKGIDSQILDMVSQGTVDENLLKSLVGEKMGMPVLSKDLVDYIYAQGQLINSLEPGRQKDVETGKLIKEVMDHVPVSFWQKVRTFQTMAQLLNMKTTIRNLVGNDMFRRVDTFTMNFLGAPIDALISKFGGGKRTTLFRPIEASKIQSKGYKEGWRLGLEDALMGIDTSESDTRFEFKSTRTFKHGVMAKLETAMSVALRATDRAAYTASFLDSLEEQMSIAGVDTPTEAMVENATLLGLYRTFNDDTKISDMFSGLKRTLNKAGAPGGEFGLGELILKYPKTPANILGRAMDYSPMGLLLTAMHLKSETSGDQYVRQRMAVEGLSRALMGTGLIAIGAILAKMGILTGSNPDDDEDIYGLKKQYGLRDFSVNVSAINRYFISGFSDTRAGELRKGDIVASYDWAEPLAMALAIGADTQLGSGEAMDMLSTVVRATETGATALADQPLLQGISNLFRYGDPVAGFTEVIKGMPASFTPTLFSQVAQFIDGRDTDPYTFYGKGRQAWNLVANRIPGLRNTMPGRVSVLGDERRYSPEDMNPILKAANIFLNPAITNKYMPSAEAELLFDLYNSSEDPDIVPRKPQKTYTIDKMKYSFTPESWEEMSRWLGKEYKNRIGRATYMRGWSPEEQAEEIKYIISEVKKEAKEKIKKIGTRLD